MRTRKILRISLTIVVSTVGRRGESIQKSRTRPQLCCTSEKAIAPRGPIQDGLVIDRHSGVIIAQLAHLINQQQFCNHASTRWRAIGRCSTQRKGTFPRIEGTYVGNIRITAKGLSRSPKSIAHRHSTSMDISCSSTKLISDLLLSTYGSPLQCKLR